jgi:hypothetical protein
MVNMANLNVFNIPGMKMLSRIYSNYRDKNYHDSHKRAAFEVIKNVEKNMGRKLTPNIIKQVDNYAISVFGKKEYAPWLYAYTLINGNFKEGWIPQNFYDIYVRPDEALLKISSIRSFSNIVFNKTILPDIAYFINGHLYDKDFSLIELSKFRLSIKDQTDEVFLKKENSLRGYGISIIPIEKINLEELIKFGNCVIQTPVKQHSFFDDFVTGPVATLRFVTVRTPTGHIECRASHLRLGHKNTKWIQSDNQISIAIPNMDGELASKGYTHEWSCFSCYPGTETKFSKKKIPYYYSALKVCLQLHSSVPHFPIVGWDIAITADNEVKLLEWNAGKPHPGILFAESIEGPCFVGLDWEKLRVSA